MPAPICPKCKLRECDYWEPLHEDDDGGYSPICGPCADRIYQADQERREFEYYHPKD
jgi:hypothetical protein